MWRKWCRVTFMTGTSNAWRNQTSKVPLPQVQSCMSELLQLAAGTIRNNRFAKVFWRSIARNQFTILPDHKPIETLMDRTQASQRLRRWNDLLLSEDVFTLETAAVDTRAMRKATFDGAEPASTLHQHAAHIEERIRTLAGTKTVCSFCNEGAKHESDRCRRKPAISNHDHVDN